MPRDQSPVLPGTVEVHFRPVPCGGLVSWDDLPTDYKLSTALADAGLPTAATGTGAVRGFREPCRAYFASKTATNPTNRATLQALADRIGRDFWAWRLVAFDRAYNGIIAPTPDGIVDAVEWTSREGECSTRMWSVPIDGEPAVLAHFDAARDCDSRPQLFGGGDDYHAKVVNGVLTLPTIRVYVVDGVLRWDRMDPEALTICPNPPMAQPSAGPMVMTTEDGTQMTTEDP